MARTKQTESEIRSVRSEQIANATGFGREPKWHKFALDPTDFNTQLGLALNWYNFNSKSGQRKKWLLEWMRTEKYTADDLRVMETIHDKYFDTHPAGCLCRMIALGAPLGDEHLKSLRKRIQILLNGARHRASMTQAVAPVKQPVCKPRLDPLVAKMIEEVEVRVDDKSIAQGKFDLAKYANEIKASKEQVRKVARFYGDKYDSVAHEYQLALKGFKNELSDEDNAFYQEAYGHLTKRHLSNLYTFFTTLSSAEDRVSISTSKVRKNAAAPEKKRKEKAAQICPQIKIGKEVYKSLDPGSIAGAREAWVYNVKYRRLGVYIAKDGAGLDVRGTKILNFNEETARNKKIRKPEESLPKFMKGKPQMSFLEKIECAWRVQHPRLNEQTVILKVVK